MTEESGAEARADAAGEDTDASRVPRAVGLSDSEWLEIETVAAAGAVSSDAFVCKAALAVAGSGAEALLPPAAVGLVARTLLTTHLLTMLKREEMVLHGRSEEFDRSLQSARATLGLPGYRCWCRYRPPARSGASASTAS